MPSVLHDPSISTAEKLILGRGSKLYAGHDFWPWSGDPAATDFEGDEFRDGFQYQMSGVQSDILSGWRRPDVPLAAWRASLQGRLDLVQDVTHDCSIVASLCVANARAAQVGDSGNGSGGDGGGGGVGASANVFAGTLFPFERPSASGRYVVKLQFNGCWRRVVIDDRLPESRSSQRLHVTVRDDEEAGRVVWPALVEKALLKVMGGYDFPGSDSANDLWTLAGWIPERVPLSNNTVGPDDLWRQIATTFRYGDVMLTLGTPKLSLLEENVYGLASGHDYAVVDIREEGDSRKLLVKNPWSHASDHLRATGKSSNIGLEVIHEDESDVGTPTSPGHVEMPGSRWMDIHDVFRRFETVYLSWNPDIFPCRKDAHFTYDLTKNSASGAFTHCPQYSVRSKKSCKLWLLLSRHIGAFHGRQNQGQPGYIGLYAFRSEYRVMLSDRSMKKTSYVNSDNVLLRLDMEADVQYAVVVTGQDLPGQTANFTLSAFSTRPLEYLKPTVDRYQHVSLVEGSWSVSSAGGNANSPLHHLNPQFSLSVPQRADIGLLLATPKKEYSINVKLVWAKGKRIQPGLPSRDIYANSGEYRKASALAEVKGVQPGTYTVVCSTFEAGYRAPFCLQLFSTAPGCALKPAPSDDAGMFRHAFMPVEFKQGVDRVLCPLKVAHTCKVRVTARGAGSSTSVDSPLKVALEYGQGPDTQVLASSGDPRSDKAALCLNEVLIQTGWCAPSSPGVWLVVERVGGAFVPHVEKVFIEVLCSTDGLQAGQWGQETDLPIEELEKKMQGL